MAKRGPWRCAHRPQTIPNLSKVLGCASSRSRVTTQEADNLAKRGESSHLCSVVISSLHDLFGLYCMGFWAL